MVRFAARRLYGSRALPSRAGLRNRRRLDSGLGSLGARLVLGPVGGIGVGSFSSLSGFSAVLEAAGRTAAQRGRQRPRTDGVASSLAATGHSSPRCPVDVGCGSADAPKQTTLSPPFAGASRDRSDGARTPQFRRDRPVRRNRPKPARNRNCGPGRGFRTRASRVRYANSGHAGTRYS
jgi:hypothetical protein